jgi:hypothetical protein
LRTAYLYRITDDETGELVKWGISQNPLTRYPSAFLAGRTLDVMTYGARREMLALERFIVERDNGYLNLERWAGQRAGAP